MNTTCSLLLADGWREYPDQFREYARCFYKRFDTPTRCACNDDKEGMQICVAVSEYEGRTSYEIDLHGELPDATWIKLQNHGMPADIEAGLATIPRLLATWEFICGNSGTTTKELYEASLWQIARRQNEEAARRSSMEVGKTLKHPDGRTVKISGGCFLDPTYGRTSNFWFWNEVMPDGSLGKDEKGYGW